MKIENLITLLLSFFIGYLLYLIMAPFFIPIFWAVVFTILFFPYYRWLLKNVSGNRTIASLLACSTIAVFLIVPMAVIGVFLADEILGLYLWSEEYLKGLSEGTLKSPLHLIDYLESYLERYVSIPGIDLHSIIMKGIKEGASFLGEALQGFIKNAGIFIINIVLAFFTMYFIFKDGERLFEIVKDLIPLSEHSREEILKRNREVIFATINGGVLVGLVQGALGGIAFWFLGLSAPLLWGFVMFLFSFLPTVGTAIIWAPAALFLFITGSWIKGLILVGWGVVVIGLSDNLLRPIIVSGRTNLHPMLLFFSILGAVNAFGFIGIIAGPLILSIALAIVDIYREYMKKRNLWDG